MTSAPYFDVVNDWLLVGGDLDLANDLTGQNYAESVAQLRGLGVTHVLDLRAEYQDRVAWGLGGLPHENYCHAPIVDSARHTPAESWYETIESFVDRFWDASATGDKLYVHCHMGINRGPSAAMLALLTVEPYLTPFAAFMMIRNARPQAGIVYAEHVGRRHIINGAGGEEAMENDYEAIAAAEEWIATMDAYWTPEAIQAVNRGIAYYRDAVFGTRVVPAAS